MSNNRQKLELTWIGKNNPEYDIANIEPRILEENPDLSYGDQNTENMIIHGDNLLALKALLPEYEGKIKCIYIDPPYNTGNAFEYYDDSVEHSTWLSLMKPRLELLKMLLREDGAIFISINYLQLGYLIILLDEVFGKINFQNIITIKTATTASFRAINSCPVNVSEQLLVYSKNKELFKSIPIYWPTDYSEDYSHYIENVEDKSENWKLVSLDQKANEYFNVEDWKGLKLKFGSEWKQKRFEFKKKIAFNSPNRVVSLNTLQKPSKKIQEIIDRSKSTKNEIFEIKRESMNSIYVFNGRTLAFFQKKFKLIDGKNIPAEIITNIWNDISFLSLGNEGGVDFPNSKKPEKLISRIFQLLTIDNDLVLDSFLGSGTTTAVAHKMGRKYIGIEMGEHAYTHVHKRMKAVVDGTDQGGISKAVDWKGGGGFKFYELAPSFVVIDEFGNPVIDSHYNDTKLIRAMCKLTNYIFSPSPSDYWKHGKGQGNNSIYVTTQMLSVAMVQQIVSHLGVNETLLICPKKYEPGCEKVDTRITIKKIPQSILKACQFGKKEYLLPIKERAIEEIDEEEVTDDEE
jgi:adenine-specific DNA-methyltransferase